MRAPRTKGSSMFLTTPPNMRATGRRFPEAAMAQVLVKGGGSPMRRALRVNAAKPSAQASCLLLRCRPFPK